MQESTEAVQIAQSGQARNSETILKCSQRLPESRRDGVERFLGLRVTDCVQGKLLLPAPDAQPVNTTQCIFRGRGEEALRDTGNELTDIRRRGQDKDSINTCACVLSEARDNSIVIGRRKIDHEMRVVAPELTNGHEGRRTVGGPSSKEEDPSLLHGADITCGID